MITNDIQLHLVDKLWSSDPNNSTKIMFMYSHQGSLSVYMNGNKLGFEDYYITDSNCSTNSIPFNETNIGASSSGNFIKTRKFCYVIEFFPDYKKIRMKPVSETQWQIFYLRQ
jgi:hypothetical protein